MRNYSEIEKVFFSLNVQTMCDANLRILDIVARWPGSTHNSTILRSSRINYRIKSNEFGNGIIVADSGYENNNPIITPLSQVNRIETYVMLYLQNAIFNLICKYRLPGPLKIFSMNHKYELEIVWSVHVVCGSVVFQFFH